MTPILLASACLLIITLSYASLCAGSPLGNCRKCRGFGFATKTTRRGRPKRGKQCRRCRGEGQRIRIGRRAYNLWLHVYRDGTPKPPRTRPKTPAQKG